MLKTFRYNNVDTDMAQLECSNNKYYASTLRYNIYR